jgi:hypothetical protein
LDMNMRTGKKPRVASGASLGLCLLVLGAGCGWAATTPIYKCLDRNLGLLYTDEPCKDGEELDIRAGNADPAAVSRLERERDMLDQSAAQRMADAGRDTVLAYEPVEERGSYDYGPAYGFGYGFMPGPFVRHHPKRPRQIKSHHLRHFAPHPPFIVPRR